MRLMSPFISMDKRNFLNGRYVCIAKLQFIPAAFIPALHLVQLQFEQKCASYICNSVESAMYPFILICVVCGQQKTNPISSLNGLLYYKMGIIHSFTKRIKVYKREREGMNRKRFFASDNKNIQNNTAAVFIFFSIRCVCI